MIFNFLLALLALLISTQLCDAYIMTCYAKTGHPKPEDIDPHLCTHLLLINDCTLNETGIHFPNVNMVRRYNKLKKKNPDLKVLVSLTPSNRYISEIAVQDSKIAAMSAIVRNYLLDNQLDGFDIDWEFPVWSADAAITDRDGLSRMVKVDGQEKLREDFDASGRKLLLTMAVCSLYNIVERAYDGPELNKYVDMVQIMNYDTHLYSKWHPFTGFNAPLRPAPYELFLLGRLNSEYATNFWLGFGIDASKLVFGIPVYGIGFEAAHETPPLSACAYIKSSKYQYFWDKYAASPYLVQDRNWLGIEDVHSVTEKAQYAKQLGIGGVMVFALDSDDYAGRCGEGKFPLTKAIRTVMQSPNRTFASSPLKFEVVEPFRRVA
ncbi:Glyco-18 domain-containing protein [Aphelenchoides fujianensis]|nr:Glyco-18 domain-containing protein [Aphelenchoides fujianensis]